MKLHLPLFLRSALLAVLAAIPFAHAAYLPSYSDYEELSYPLELSSDSVDIISNITLDHADLNWQGVRITVDPSAKVEMHSGNISAYTYTDEEGETETVNSNLSIRNGGVFMMSGGNVDVSSLSVSGTLRLTDTYTVEKEVLNEETGNTEIITETRTRDSRINTTEMDVTGSFEMEGGELTFLHLDLKGSLNISGGKLLGVSDKAVEPAIASTLTVNEGASFTLSGANTIASSDHITVDGSFRVTQGCVIFTDMNVNSSINLSGGRLLGIANTTNGSETPSTLYVGEQASIHMYAHTQPAKGNPDETQVTNPSIEAGVIAMNGEFEMQAGMLAFSEMTLTGSFDMSGGLITNLKDGENALMMMQDYAVFDMQGGSISNTNITMTAGTLFIMDEKDAETHSRLSGSSIDMAGTFEMNSGTIALSITDKDALVVRGGGVFNMHDGKIEGGVFKQGYFHVSVETGGVFHMNDGSISAAVNVSGMFDMVDGSFDTATVQVSDNGRFEMTKGSINASDITICDEGRFEMNSGNVTGGSITVSDDGVFQLEHDALISGGTDITLESGGTFNMLHGNIRNAGHITLNGKESTFNVNAGTIAANAISTGGQFNMNNGYLDARSITVKQDGVFNMINGFVGSLIGGSLTVNVEGDGAIVHTGGAIGYRDSDDVFINIAKDGLYELKAGAVIAHDGDAFITIAKEGRMDIQEGIIAFGEGSSTQITVNGELTLSSGTIADSGSAVITLSSYGSIQMSGGYIARVGTADITINEFSTYTMTDGRIAYMGDAVLNVDYTGTFDMQGGTLAESGSAEISVAGKFLMKSGYIAKESISSTSISVTGGRFEMEAPEGSIAYLGSADIEVNNAGIFTLRSGNIAYAVGSRGNIVVNPGGTFVMEGGAIAASGTASIIVRDGGAFLMEDGDIALTFAGKAQIIVGNGGVFTMSGGHIAAAGNADILMLENGRFNYEGGEIHAKANITVADNATFNMSDLAFAHDITMVGGKLEGVAAYGGQVRIRSAAAYTGNIDLGGMKAEQVVQVQTGAGVTISGLTGKLTLHEGDYLTVSAGNIGAEGATPIISFVEGAGTLALDGLVTLSFDAECLQTVRDENNYAKFEVWLTNGKLSSADKEKLIYESGLEIWFTEDMSAEIKDGKLLLSGTLGDVWFASEHSELIELVDENANPDEAAEPVWVEVTLTDSDEFHKDYAKVVIDTDTFLTLTGNATLRHLEGSRTLTLDGAGQVELENTASTAYRGDIIAGEDVTLVKTGKGGFVMGGDLIAETLHVREGDFIIAKTSTAEIGTLNGRVTVEGSLTLDGGAAEIHNLGHVELTGNATRTTTLTSLDMDGSSTLTLRAGSGDRVAHSGADIHLTGSAIFRSGSTTTLVLNANSSELWNASKALMISADKSITIERGAGFTLHSLQTAPPTDHRADLKDVLVMRGKDVKITGNAKASNTLDVTLDGLFYVYYEKANLTVQGNEVLFNAHLRDQYKKDSNAPGLFEKTAQATERNNSVAQSGGAMLDRLNLMADDTLMQFGEALGSMLSAGENDTATRALTAAAGNSVTALGASQRDALRGQLLRSQKHAALSHSSHPKSTRLHTWIEGSADYARMNADGAESGYHLSSWGGSVGMDYAANDSLSFGLGVAAQYGNLYAHSTDMVKGNLDSYYFSLWTHIQNSRWGHTLLAVLSTSDAELNRTVNYGTGSYHTEGSTSGQGYGLLYEVTYDLARGTDSILQPLFSISYLSTSMDSYEETGAEGAGLSVGDQEQSFTTISAGARWQKRAWTNALERSAIVELSARVSQDIGDSRVEAQNALLANPKYSRMMQSAEIGSTALQLGAGLSLPVGKNSRVYVNGNADIRSGSNSWNVNAGLNHSF